jgi:peptidyl-prolyl cis-trans isomerase SurA
MPKPAFRHLLLVLAGILAGLLPAMAQPATDAGKEPAASTIDRILIVVNDDVITASEVEAHMAMISRRLATQKVNLPPPEVLRRQVMERMVIERLQLQAARQAGITESDEGLERAIRRIAEQNHKKPEALLKEMEKEPGGVRGFREEVRTQLVLQQLIDREINNRIVVTEAEVDNFLAGQAARGDIEYNLSHILLGLPESASPDVIQRARQKAERILADLQHGADFGQLAAAHSQGQTALEGGNLGWKPAGQLPDLFVNALRDLQPGQVSPVLRSPNGFHILRLNDKRGGATTVNVTQTHVRHILIRASELVPVPEALRRAAQLRERLVNGEDFGQAARARSDDTGSAAKNGDLGWVNPGQLVPEFEKAMNALKPGEISQPVTTAFGVHLIQVLERRERDVGQERARANARSQIHARKADERQEQWLRQLRDEAYVEYRLDEPHA